MQITPNEIDTIEDAGLLDGAPVKLLRTKGGFWIACGKPKGKLKEEALSAGSHPAIVKYNLEKMYPTFQASMMKSEHAIEPVTEKHSHFLTDDLRKSGHDIYSIQSGTNIDFLLTKQNITVASINTELEDSNLVVKKMSVPKETADSEAFRKAMSAAWVEKGNSLNINKLKFES